MSDSSSAAMLVSVEESESSKSLALPNSRHVNRASPFNICHNHTYTRRAQNQ